MQDIDYLLKKILRVSPEPFGYFDEKLVHFLLTDRPLEYYLFVRDELSEIAGGRSQLDLPPKQVFSDPDSDSDFRVMPCVVRGVRGMRKTVKLVGTNTLQHMVPDQVTVGKAFAIHPEENFVSHIFEACLLSSARTGICAAIAIDLLSGCRKKVILYGAGRVAYYTAFYAATLGGVSEVCLTDVYPERAQQTAALLSSQIPAVQFTAKTSEELKDADVLVLATTSTKPICSPPGFGANLIISLGADTNYQHELDPAWATVADIYADTKDSACYGDLRTWQEKGLISAENLVELLEVMRRKESKAFMRPRVFASTGSALFDNLTIGYLLSRSHGQPGHDIVAISEIKSSYL